MNKTRILLLQTLNDLAQALEFLDFNLRLLLVDINNLQFSSIQSLPSLTLSKEGSLLSLDNVSGDVSQLSVLSNLVWRPGTDWLTIDIDIRLLSHVKPDDGSILGVVGSSHLLKSLLKSLLGGLTTAVDLETWDSSEVWTSYLQNLLFSP